MSVNANTQEPIVVRLSRDQHLPDKRRLTFWLLPLRRRQTKQLQAIQQRWNNLAQDSSDEDATQVLDDLQAFLFNLMTGWSNAYAFDGSAIVFDHATPNCMEDLLTDSELMELFTSYLEANQPGASDRKKSGSPWLSATAPPANDAATPADVATSLPNQTPYYSYAPSVPETDAPIVATDGSTWWGVQDSE